ncbi:hypothetical protein [Neptunomonas japonica]|uniref:Lipoprotein n=1 Tax=Neptunomonas japonica JAMM 1380 TaxID=1441457 RepID=A0A7R6PWD4_9GAMM|nr:hypothetical protein [Neptunomonas japonica]BBB30733.1 hypothetical protein NEJAP_2792 [Neptunomonas japonica JAMM 1380]
MKSTITAIVLSALSLNTFASSAIIRLPDGQLAQPGTSVNRIIHAWGSPDMDIRSERTCKYIKIKKSSYCSSWRFVWKRDDLYWMVQYKGSMIVDTKWTRFKNGLKDEF